jgi:ankyrin repeat protein
VQIPTPLVAALARRHYQTAELLRHNGADMNACYGEGATPLHAAVWHGDFEMVQLLLNYKVGFCLIPNIYQSLPDVARLSLQHDADVNAQISDGTCPGQTPLYLVAEGRSVDVAHVLLEHGVNADAKDHQGRTPFPDCVGEWVQQRYKIAVGHGAK